MYLKYTLKNIKSFFLNNFTLFVLVVLSTITSSIIIFFAYGVYQNYNIILGNQDGELVENYIVIEYVRDGSDYVTKQDLVNCMNDIDGISDDLSEKITLYTVDGLIDGNSYEFKFLYSDGSYKLAEEFMENLKKYDNLTEGTYWSDYEEANGICVALIPDTNAFGDIPELDSIRNGDGLLIGGKEYEIIGKHEWNMDGAMFPFSTVSDDREITQTLITFDSTLSTKTYSNIKNIFETYMGDMAVIYSTEIIDKDTYYTYKTVILISIIIALIAAVNFMILYRYIVSIRKRTTAIYKILGMTSGKLNLINLTECIILIVPFFALGMVIFRYALLPRLGVYFMYMQDAYSPLIYLALFLIFVLISIAVVGIMLFSMNRKSILELIKDRG